MKKILQRLLLLIIASSLLMSAGSCSTSGYKVTGKTEDGQLVVWASPKMSGQGQTDYQKQLPYYTGFFNDIKTVIFDNEEEFRQKLAQSIPAGSGPDVVLACMDELPPKLFKSGAFMDLDPFWDYEDNRSDATVKRKDLIPALFDICRFGGAPGRQETIPFSFQITINAAFRLSSTEFLPMTTSNSPGSTTH